MSAYCIPQFVSGAKNIKLNKTWPSRAMALMAAISPSIDYMLGMLLYDL